MINGVFVGVVIQNKDPEGLHRVMVEYPVDGRIKSQWCRMISPNAGEQRGLVMIPDIDTEVILTFSFRSLLPYVIGAVYNGTDDKPEPYCNDDKENNKRVLWSRNNHLLVFDDTSGEEKVEIAAVASTSSNASEAPIFHQLNSAERKITEYCDGITHYRSGRSLTIKCKSLSIKTNDLVLTSNQACSVVSQEIIINNGSAFRTNSPNTLVKKSGSPVSPVSAPRAPRALHTPKG